MAYLINGLTFAMMLFILSTGLNIVLGFLGVFNFAHGALFIWAPMLRTRSQTLWETIGRPSL